MSSETRLKHKVNRKLKLKSAKFMSITDEKKRTRDVIGSLKFCDKETGEKRNSRENAKKITASKASVEKVGEKEKEILRKNIHVSRSSNLKRKVQNYGTPRFRPPSHNIKYAVESTQASKGRRTTKNKKVQLQNRESLTMDVDQSGSSKPFTRRKSTLGRSVDINLQKSPDFPPKRKVLKVKKEDNDVDDKPRKKKRVIRLDPYDISNKRLNDGIIANENMEMKNIDLEKKNEMSKNAEFRAIQPSPSIISFVEDNLLGRRRSIELQRAGYNTDLSAPLDNIPFSTSKDRERTEENMFRNKLTFFAAAKVSSSFPPPELPEVAFAGRSNVGKSSLLNALTRQWGVARTSDKPGLTQTINFFNLGSKLNLVDLPGYGFAYAKEEVKESWEELVKEYVSTRSCLKRVCLLIDTKWGMKPRDDELIDLMERSRTKYQIVLTKTDVVFPADVARRAMQIEEKLKRHKSVVEPVMMVSSKSGAGIRCLRTALAKISRFAKI